MGLLKLFGLKKVVDDLTENLKKEPAEVPDDLTPKYVTTHFGDMVAISHYKNRMVSQNTKLCHERLSSMTISELLLWFGTLHETNKLEILYNISGVSVCRIEDFVAYKQVVGAFYDALNKKLKEKKDESS